MALSGGRIRGGTTNTKNKDTGSSITNVEDDRRGNVEDDRRGNVEDDRKGEGEDDRRGEGENDRRGAGRIAHLRIPVIPKPFDRFFQGYFRRGLG